MPVQARLETCSPRTRAISAAKIGCAATNAVAEATEVMLRLGVQVAKWAPSATPPPSAASHCDRRIARSSRACRQSANGASAPTPIALRQNAIASAGAAVAAISGPEVPTAAMATASTAMSARGGRWTALTRGAAGAAAGAAVWAVRGVPPSRV